MPTAVTEESYLNLSDDAMRKRWTREECAIVEASGLWEEQHWELVEGELINKMGKKRPHTNGLIVVQAWLI